MMMIRMTNCPVRNPLLHRRMLPLQLPPVPPHALCRLPYRSHPRNKQPKHNLNPQQIQQPRQQEQQHPTIVAPRPGYAAPIAVFNLACPENAKTRSPPQPIQVPSPIENPFEPPPMVQVYDPLVPHSYLTHLRRTRHQLPILFKHR